MRADLVIAFPSGEEVTLCGILRTQSVLPVSLPSCGGLPMPLQGDRWRISPYELFSSMSACGGSFPCAARPRLS